MAQALGLFDSASGHAASVLGVVDFSEEAFTGHPPASAGLAPRSESYPATIWIAAGVDAEGRGSDYGKAGGIMPDARVYDRSANPLGESIHDTGVWEGDTNFIVVPQNDKNPGHYTLFSGNRDTGNSLDNSICIAWATIHWPAKDQTEGPKYAWSGGWGRACEAWGAQWYYSGMTIPGSDGYTPDCLWVYNWDQKRDHAYPPGTNATHPPFQGFHINWADMKSDERDPRLNTSAQAMCDTRSFRLYKNYDPQDLVLRDGEIGRPPSIVPTSHYTSSEQTTTEQSTTESSTTGPTTGPTTEPTTESTTTDPTSKSETKPTSTTESENTSTTLSTSVSITTIPESSITTDDYITRTITVKPPARRNKRKTGDKSDQHHHQQPSPRQQSQDRSHPAAHGSHRGTSIPDKFANVLVINDHERQTASGLCESQGSLGPSFADARARVYCDMETKTLYPFCGAGDGEFKVCFDFEGSKMLRGPGVQRRQAPKVQDWRVRRGQQGGR